MAKPLPYGVFEDLREGGGGYWAYYRVDGGVPLAVHGDTPGEAQQRLDILKGVVGDKAWTAWQPRREVADAQAE